MDSSTRIGVSGALIGAAVASTIHVLIRDAGPLAISAVGVALGVVSVVIATALLLTAPRR